MKNVLIVLVIVIAGFAVFVATRPAAFRVERSTSIAAPADVVFGEINDFHNWVHWSPWEKMDPAMKKTFSGSASGAGAVYEWNGNDKVGQGRMTLTESKANDQVGIKLEFMKPYEMTNMVTLSTKADGPATKVVWAMEGTNGFVGKAMSLFMDMDKMLGKDFEDGLSNLKNVSEMEAKNRATAAAAVPPAPAAPAAAPAPGATPAPAPKVQ